MGYSPPPLGDGALQIAADFRGVCSGMGSFFFDGIETLSPFFLLQPTEFFTSSEDFSIIRRGLLFFFFPPRQVWYTHMAIG